MYKCSCLFIVSFFVFIINCNAQLGVGTTTPDASSMLDVTSTTKGVLVPRMTTTQRTAITSPANGLLVFDTDTNTFWFYASSAWVNLSAAANTGWSLTGNSGTDPNTQFIGTTDNQPLIFKVNNLQAGKINGFNTAIGASALLTNSTGTNNTAIGVSALFSNTTGSYNTASGLNALFSNTTGNNNTASGQNALLGNTTGGNNTANGQGALYTNRTGSANTAIGVNALGNNTTANDNTATGTNALYFNTTGFYNTANGSQALFSNTTGVGNTANGQGALYSNTTGTLNTATGTSALYNNTTGSFNTASGNGTLFYNTTGSNNTASGIEALHGNTTGASNTASGTSALHVNTTGSFNTASGVQTLYSNTTGSGNTANGYNALSSNTTGNYNSASGDNALFSNTTGTNNTSIGLNALFSNTTGNSNTAIGYFANVLFENLSNATAIGANSTVGCSNCLVLGNNANVGIGQNTPSYPLTFASNLGDKISLWGNSGSHYGFGIQPSTLQIYTDGSTSNIAFGYGSSGSFSQTFAVYGNGNAVLSGTLTQFSDKRLKKNIAPLSYALNKILALHGYNYNWKDQKADPSRQTGIIAQEVEKVMPELVRKDDKGMMSVNYEGLIPYLIESIKEQQNTIEKQEKENLRLKEKLAKLDTEFNDKLNSLTKAFKQMQDLVQKKTEINNTNSSK